MGHLIYFDEPFDVPFLSHGKLGLQKRQRYALSFPTTNKEKKQKERKCFQGTEVKETVQEFSYLTKLQCLDKERRHQKSFSNEILP